MARSFTLFSLELPRGIGYMVYVVDDADKVFSGFSHFESFNQVMRGKSRVFTDAFQRWWRFLNG